MNILVLSQCWFGDTIGGAFFLASEQAKAFATCGHQVTFICCGLHRDAEIKIAQQDGLEIWRYPLPDENASGVSKLKHHCEWTSRAVQQILENEPLDFAFGHSPLQSKGFITARGNLQIPFCYQVHSPFPDEIQAQQTSSTWVGRIKITMAKRIERKLVQQADVIVGESHFTKRRLAHLYGKSILSKCKVVPGVVDVEKFQPAINRKLLRQKLSTEWQSDKTIFFTLRRLERRMGIEDLVRAAAKLTDENDQFRVLIGGGGSMREELEQLTQQLGISELVKFLGRVDDESLAHCYAAADCFVLPTRSLECFGLIVLEAFACNTPVIGSDAGAIPELVDQQNGNWSFPSGNVDALASRMQKFLSGNLKVDGCLRALAQEYSYDNIVPLWCEQISLDKESARV